MDKLTNEWNYLKNKGIKPENMMEVKNRKVWWICEKNHEWQATISKRMQGTECPYCSNHTVLKGFNDLKSNYPDIASEWNYEINKIKPSEISKKSSKKVWWKCKKGHEWESRVADRVRGNGCPYCSGKVPIVGKNDLKTIFPKVIEEWDYNKNKYAPESYMPHSGKKVFWKCKRGHEWEATIDSRTRGNNCPYCAGQRVLVGVNDLLTVAPDLAKQWDYEKNKDYTPQLICGNSNKKVWWKCDNGHSWCVSPNSRFTNHSGCPKCSAQLKTSFPEQAIFYYLSKIFNNVQNRFLINGKMEIDVYIRELGIGVEYDGIVYHSNKKAKERERRKNKLCKQKGIKLYRVKEVRKRNVQDSCEIIYNNVMNGSDGLENAIKRLIKKLLEEIDCEEANVDINIQRDRNEIMSRYISNDNLVTNNINTILEEWDYEKNKSLLPSMLHRGSNEKVWWKCKKGHEWKTAMYHRTQENNKSTGCPYCSNKKVLSGFNDLATTCKELLKEWNYEKNKDITPTKYTKGSGKKVWWICEKGHEWEASINKRANGRNCPICSGKKIIEGINDFGVEYPELLNEWNYNRNEKMPGQYGKASNKKVWWVCEKGHEWKISVSHRTRGRGCPYCANQKILIGYNDIMTTNPELSEIWDYEKNDISIYDCVAGSSKKVHWKCGNNHEWERCIRNQAKNNTCPICSKQGN